MGTVFSLRRDSSFERGSWSSQNLGQQIDKTLAATETNSRNFHPTIQIAPFLNQSFSRRITSAVLCTTFLQRSTQCFFHRPEVPSSIKLENSFNRRHGRDIFLLFAFFVIRSISMPATQSSHEFLFQARRVLQLCLEGLAYRL